MPLVEWGTVHRGINIHNEMDRFFGNYFGNIKDVSDSDTDSVWIPKADISDTENDVFVTLELPGVKKDDVKISIQDNVLTVRGEKKPEGEKKEKNCRCDERSYGKFQRDFNLAYTVEAKKVKADFKDGVIKIVMPKAEEAKIKEIPISVN